MRRWFQQLHSTSVTDPDASSEKAGFPRNGQPAHLNASPFEQFPQLEAYSLLSVVSLKVTASPLSSFSSCSFRLFDCEGVDRVG